MARKKYPIEDMRKFAEERGGKCLSETYENIDSKLKWQCKEGHKWETSANSVVNQGTWCKNCYHIRRADQQRGSIEDMRKIAKKRGGKCLSNTYVNNQTKLKWQCGKCDHIWFATPANIKHHKRWCPVCAGNQKLSIEDMREIARQRGGKCLSETYKNIDSKLWWKCGNCGYEWEASANSVKNQKTWCKICAGIKELTIKEMKEIAESRGGKCLSDHYINAHQPLEWECSNGHRWSVPATQIKHANTWCPDCYSSLSEKITREWFKVIFLDDFPKSRPKWLINPTTNRRMELDGYNKIKGIAFEYQGIQHYEPHYGKSALEKLIKRDNIKRELCEANNVFLIEISYKVPHSDIGKFIIKQCEKKSINIPLPDVHDIDYRTFDVYDDNRLEEMKYIARQRGGDCLSTVYVNQKTKLHWICSKGHEWWATPRDVKHGNTWCLKCSGHEPYSIEDMQTLAESKRGKCLSTEYKGVRIKLQWVCKEGHKWWAPPNSIVQGHWCNRCAKKKVALEREANKRKAKKKL